MGLILDTSILVDAERQHGNVERLLRDAHARLGDQPIEISAVTVAELAHGLYRANTPELRTFRRTFLDAVKTSFSIHAVTAGTAELAGRLQAECAVRGNRIPLPDLLIAACAIELNYAVATRNRRHFDAIPGLELISL